MKEKNNTKTKYKYKFTVIMSIYNVEEYLREAIESIVNQNIGFEENVQLILINDGSSDGCEEICLEYKEKFPNNIIYIAKENGGVASAKNLGLKYREGKYINFCDPDDKLRANTLKEVFSFFELNYNMIEYVAIPLYFFGARKGFHPKYDEMGFKNRIINLDLEPNNFTLSSASAFYKTEIFDEMSFNEELVMGEDAYLNMMIQKRTHCLGYVAENKVKYFYRKRSDRSSLVDNFVKEKTNFYLSFRIWEKIAEGEKVIPKFMKAFFVYDSIGKIKQLNPNIFDSQEEYEYVLQGYRNAIEQIGDDYLINEAKILNSKNLKFIYLSRLLENKQAFKLKENGYVSNGIYNMFPITGFELIFSNYEFKKDKIRLEMLFFDYYVKDIELVARNKNGKKIKWADHIRGNTGMDRKYGEFVTSTTNMYILEIPYEKIKISFYIRDKKNQKEYRINNIIVNPKSAFVLKDNNIRAFHGDYNLKYNTYEITLKKFKYTGLKYNKYTYKHIKKTYNFKAKFRLLNRRKKKYILVNDRPQKAGDNGEAIFKYINKNEKQLAKKTYYVISKDCEDYRRMKKYGKVVKLNSLKHKFLFLNSRAILSSHTHPLFFNAFEPKNLKYYIDMFNYKFIWLQHGILEKDVSTGSNKYKAGYDYMVVSTEGERDEVKQDKYLIYDKNRIILNGLPRYDYLENRPKNIITIAPTWRQYLSGAISSTGYHETKSGFEESEYFKNYSEILSNKKIYDLLEKNNYKLNFLLHPGMAGYEEFFEKFQNDRIKIVKAEDIDYGKVFKESKLLVTDYSSIAFDFAYLKKPIIYFQFDKDLFFSKHYKKGYFEYERDGLGEVTYTCEQTINKIEDYFKKDFTMEEEYVNRVNNTYKYIDKNNCKRLVDYLKKKKVLK